jgi:GTP-binding protein Era
MDTPGFHKPKNKLSEHMIKAVNESVTELDIVMLVVDCTKKISNAELELINNFKQSKTPAILVINKIDLIDNKSELLQIIDEYSKLYDFKSVIPVSVLNDDGLDIILKELENNAEEGPHYFPEDMLTDQPEKVIAAEIIREKILNLMSDEIPHGVAVLIEKMRERDDKDILDIEAIIYCEKESHKGMIIGKNGSMLKKIGSLSREELESFFQIKINLQCWVKVKESWRNREGIIKNFGLS